MADFNKALTDLLRYEGGYSYHKSDKGRETYKGVSRRYHPEWAGWKIVDSYKGSPTFYEDLKESTYLQEEVFSFYKVKFWDRFWGDKITDERIAGELFEQSVNLSVRRAVKFLQTSLNVLNREGSLYKDIKVDGMFGVNTFSTVIEALREGLDEYLFNCLNLLQGAFYIKQTEKDSSQEVFLRGWLSRVVIAKGRK